MRWATGMIISGGSGSRFIVLRTALSRVILPWFCKKP